MRVLMGLTYFRPYVSGLTIYVDRLASALAERGHTVTVLTSRYDPSLPQRETMNTVEVVRAPVAARISKGVLMPRLGGIAHSLMREHDIVSLHLPQFDAAGLSVRARLAGKPVVLTYHWDLQLPAGWFNRVVDRVVFAANYAAATLADRIVSYTRDYADHSQLLSRFPAKTVIIPPPVVMPAPTTDQVEAFAREHIQDHGPVIGFAARMAAEKGVEYLVQAMPMLLERHPKLKVLFAGPYDNVLGEEAYWQRMRPAIERLDGHWEFVGTLSPAEMSPFFGACDVLVVPSLNSTESFGLVQVEAMLCGTPVIASDLPGVRQPIRMTGMGEIVPPADADALTSKLLEVLERRASYVRPRAEIAATFAIERTVEAYESLFRQLISARTDRAFSRAAG
jgi:glycosyltransferase involved in cell wall biosynthesis